MGTTLWDVVKTKDNKWSVLWPRDRWVPVATFDGVLNLFDFVLGITSDDIQLIVTRNDQYYIHYIDRYTILDKRVASHIANEICSRSQNVMGIQFNKKEESEKFIEELEKRYFWKLLKEENL